MIGSLDDPNWQRSRRGYERLEDRIVDGKYQGRPVITRDSPIDGGVYLGESMREAIVVDSAKFAGLQALYTRATELATQAGMTEDAVLRATYDAVRGKMKYNEKKFNRLIRENGVSHDGKISLDTFINAEAGICRHFALAVGAILELFKRDGHLNGQISVDRCTNEAGNGHAWVRYTREDGEVLIVDAVHERIVPLLAAPRQGWNYLRPEDREKKKQF